MSDVEDQSTQQGADNFPALPIAPTGDDGKFTEDEQTEADEWASAADEIFPGLKSLEEGKDGEQAKSEKDGQEDGAGEDASKGKEHDARQGDGDDSEAAGDGSEKDGDKSDGQDADDDAGEDDEEDAALEPTAANARLTEREQQQQIEGIRNDVRTKLFGEVQTELRDRDGNPIRTPSDVMTFINPATGEPFTRDEATDWLTDQKARLDEHNKGIESEVSRITDLNMNLKDQVDVIDYEFGELLKVMPELKDQLWADFMATATQDEKSKIITKAPVNLEQFYRRALEPYAEMGRRLEAQETSAQEQQATQEQQAQQQREQQEEKRQLKRQDRFDIYGSGKQDTRTDDQKDWDAAAQAVFGDQLKAFK